MRQLQKLLVQDAKKARGMLGERRAPFTGTLAALVPFVARAG
jgi:hypothetical protein